MQPTLPKLSSASGFPRHGYARCCTPRAAAIHAPFRLQAPWACPRRSRLPAELYEQYGNVTAMLAAYNAGAGRYEASLAGKDLPPQTCVYIAAPVGLIDGGAAGEPLSIHCSNARGWRNAPLFAVPPERSNLTDAASITPQPRDLFVAPVHTRRKP